MPNRSVPAAASPTSPGTSALRLSPSSSDRTALALCLQQADIEGKGTILANLDEILARYVTLAIDERSST